MNLTIKLFLLFLCTTCYGARSVKCDDTKSVEIYMRPAFATVLNFPVKPEQVIIGGKSQVSIEYIRNDLALTPLTSNSKTNIFVYMQGRRCGFNLRMSTQNFDSLVNIRDPEESKMKVRMQ